MEMTHTFTVSDEQLEQLELLQKAMKNYAVQSGNDTQEEADEYYTIQKVFEFVMQLGQNHMIDERIENAAYHYDDYYEEGTYKFEYGLGKFKRELKEE